MSHACGDGVPLQLEPSRRFDVAHTRSPWTWLPSRASWSFRFPHGPVAVNLPVGRKACRVRVLCLVASCGLGIARPGFCH